MSMMPMPNWEGALSEQVRLLRTEAAAQSQWQQEGADEAAPERYVSASTYAETALHLYRERLPQLMRQIAGDLESQGLPDVFDQAEQLRTNDAHGLTAWQNDSSRRA